MQPVLALLADTFEDMLPLLCLLYSVLADY